MMRYTCTACDMGMHDLCAGRQAPPPGMLGGSECDCDGNCEERKSKRKGSGNSQIDRILDSLPEAKDE